jgi:UDP-galactopyranose mutase
VKATVLGGGFAGTTVAHLLARDGWEVTLIEKEPHLGGGCRTFFYGGHPFTYGPRVYYGYSAKVWKWIDSIIPMRRFPFELLTYVEDEQRFFSYPIHQDDIPHMKNAVQIWLEIASADNSKEPRDFEEYWIQRVGRTLYDMFVNGYSKKMWMINDNRIFDIFKWSAKDKAIESGTKEAYKGSYIGYPANLHGYNPYFDRMTQGVEVLTEHEFKHDEFVRSDAIISTIPIDEFCGYKYGELPYVGRDFTVFILPCKQAFPGDVRFCHYAGQEPHTRITEFKKITYYDSPDSLFVLETPSKRNKLYPYLTKANTALTKKYLDSLPPNVHSIGRLGTYRYSTIEQTICQAFECYAKITGKPNPMDGEFFGIGDTAMMKNRGEDSGLKRAA